MMTKSKIFFVAIIMFVLILSISMLVYAAAENYYDKITPKGIFVYNDIGLGELY